MFVQQLKNMATLLLLCRLGYPLSAQIPNATKWQAQLDDMASSVGSKNYTEAVKQMMPLFHELMKANSGKPMPQLNPSKDILPTDEAIIEAIRRLRVELGQSDVEQTRKTAYVLGISLQSRVYSMSAGEQLRAAKSSPTNMTSGAAGIRNAARQSMLAWKAGQFDEAERLARQVLSAQGTVPEIEREVHRAYATLGLVALERKNVIVAREMLLQSIKGIKPDLTTGVGQPNLTLADALLQIGEKDVVVSYLRACLEFPGFTAPIVKEKLERYRTEVEAGQRKNFAGEAQFLY